MTRIICFDTEFHDTGKTIDLISIGLVDDAGEEYYAVSTDFDVPAVLAHPWLFENVWSALPTRTVKTSPSGRRSRFELDLSDPAVKPRSVIAAEVGEFILREGADCELWAWYDAYDHVALCQLWGRMVYDVPEGVPHYTNCLRQARAQLERHLGHRVTVPEQALGEHNALYDARHNWAIKGHLESIAKSFGGCL